MAQLILPPDWRHMHGEAKLLPTESNKKQEFGTLLFGFALYSGMTKLYWKKIVVIIGEISDLKSPIHKYLLTTVNIEHSTST